MSTRVLAPADAGAARKAARVAVRLPSPTTVAAAAVNKIFMSSIAERIVFGLFLLLYLVILIGIAAKGVVDFAKGYFLADKVVGALFIVVGLLFSAIVIRYARAFLVPKWKSPIRTWWRKKKRQIVASGILFLVLIAVRSSLNTSLPYLGLMVGGFVVDQARIGWLRLLRIDLSTVGFFHLAWLFQWYYVDIIVGWFLRIARRFRGKGSPT